MSIHRAILVVIAAIALLSTVECRLLTTQSSVLDATIEQHPSSAVAAAPAPAPALTQTHSEATTTTELANTFVYADEKQDRMYPNQLLTTVVYQVPKGHVLWHAVVEPKSSSSSPSPSITFDPSTATSFSSDPSEQFRLGVARELGRRKQSGDKSPYTPIRVVRCVVQKQFELYQLSKQFPLKRTGFSNPFLSTHDPRYKAFCDEESKRVTKYKFKEWFSGFRDPDHRDEFALCPGVAQEYITCDSQQGWTCPAEAWSSKISFSAKRSISSSIKSLFGKQDKAFYLYSVNAGENYYIYPKMSGSGDKPDQGAKFDVSGQLLDTPDLCAYHGAPHVKYADIMKYMSSDATYHKPIAQVALEAKLATQKKAIQDALNLRDLILRTQYPPIYLPEDGLDKEPGYVKKKNEQVAAYYSLVDNFNLNFPREFRYDTLTIEELGRINRLNEQAYYDYISKYGQDGKTIWTKEMKKRQKHHEAVRESQADDPLQKLHADTESKMKGEEKSAPSPHHHHTHKPQL